jgi:phenylpropionate dioxygenase-like ring-hydroxylating dioxygenase large terminal subunit
MGPPEKQPPFPIYDSLVREGYKIIPGKKYFYPCNWLQILENAMDPVHTAFLHTIVTGSQFTDQFGVVPELDFMETPAGIIYMASRRVGDNIWVRMVENVLPNLQQVAPVWEDGKVEHAFDGPMMSRWIVPQDDNSTMFVELRHISDAEATPAWWADRNVMLPAQLPISESLEDQQRQPTDYEAQVSQRPIAVHGMEHLGATDRGVTMFRRQVRRGIRSVEEGRDPEGLSREEGRVIPTYCNDTVVQVPPAATPEEDKKLMRETARRLAEEYLENPPLLRDIAARP